MPVQYIKKTISFIYSIMVLFIHLLTIGTIFYLACICFRYQLQYNSLHLITGTNIHNTIALLGGYD